MGIASFNQLIMYDLSTDCLIPLTSADVRVNFRGKCNLINTYIMRDRNYARYTRKADKAS
jgi:hypothetical protein